MQILQVGQFREKCSMWNTLVPTFIDFETNGKEAWELDFRIVCMSLTGRLRLDNSLDSIQIPFSHQTGQNAEVGMIAAVAEFISSFPVAAFWAAAEVRPAIARMGVVPALVDDPYIALRLLQVTGVFSFKDAGEKFLNKKMTRLEELLPAGVYDFSLMDAQDQKGIEYSEQDSFDGQRLLAVLKPKIINAKMQAVYELEVKAAVIMAEQTFRGYEMDVPTLERELQNEEVALEALEREIFQTLECSAFKINSGPQLGKALAKWGISSPTRTGKGAESWAQDVIESIKDRHVALPKILNWKSRFSVRNTLRKSPARVAVDGKIHPNWKVIGADGTSRMYAEDPSITSLPEACRRSMPAPAGKRWMKFDWKQAELRFLAAASKDEALAALFESGIDIHRAIYARMKGITPEEVTSNQREASKVISYSILYSGGSPYNVARELKISMEEAQSLVTDYFAQFPQLSGFLKQVRAQALSTYHVRTFMGRLRRLEGIDKEKIMNQACDAMGQQSCGTALKVALAKMVNFRDLGHPLMKGLCQIIPVFDAIFYCIDVDVPIKPHLTYMRDWVELNIEGIKLDAEFETGPSWGELQPLDEKTAQATVDLMGGVSTVEKAIQQKDAAEAAYQRVHGL